MATTIQYSTVTEPDTMTIDEIAERMQIHRTTAYELARQDALPAPVIRAGRRLFVSRRAYEAVMAARHAPTSPGAT